MQDGMKFCTICGAPLSGDDEKVNLDKGSPFEAADGMGGSFDNSANNAQQGYGQAGYGQPQYGNQGQQQYYGGYGQPGGGFNGGYGNNFGIPTRSIATCIILSFLTCGIYLYYWLYCITEETNRFSNEPNPTTGGTTILLGLVTCGIYFVYWYYKRGELIDNYYVSRGYPPQSNAVLYLILSLIGLGLVSMAMMQSELNKISRGM